MQIWRKSFQSLTELSDTKGDGPGKKPKRTHHYIETVPNTPEGHKRIGEIKATVIATNKKREEGTGRLKTTVKARLGKKSPYAKHYTNRGQQTIKREHASHFDVYVHHR